MRTKYRYQVARDVACLLSVRPRRGLAGIWTRLECRCRFNFGAIDLDSVHHQTVFFFRQLNCIFMQLIFGVEKK